MAATSINILKCEIFTSTSPLVLLPIYNEYATSALLLLMFYSRRQSRMQGMDGNNDIWREGVINAYNFEVLNLGYVCLCIVSLDREEGVQQHNIDAVVANILCYRVTS